MSLTKKGPILGDVRDEIVEVENIWCDPCEHKCVVERQHSFRLELRLLPELFLNATEDDIVTSAKEASILHGISRSLFPASFLPPLPSTSQGKVLSQIPPSIGLPAANIEIEIESCGATLQRRHFVQVLSQPSPGEMRRLARFVSRHWT
jgi:hypothetical protein